MKETTQNMDEIKAACSAYGKKDEEAGFGLIGSLWNVLLYRFDEATRKLQNAEGYGEDYCGCEECGMSIAEYIDYLADNTDEDGFVTIPTWNTEYRYPRYFFVNCMQWTEEDRAELVGVSQGLYDALSEIAKQHSRLSDSEEENEAILSPELMYVWRTFVRPYDTSAFDPERIREIALRKETLEEAQEMIKKSEFDFYLGLVHHTERAREEDRYYDDCLFALREQVRTRLGRKPTSYPLALRAWQLYRLMVVKAPQHCLDHAAQELVQMLAFHRYAETFSVLFLDTHEMIQAE